MVLVHYIILKAKFATQVTGRKIISMDLVTFLIIILQAKKRMNYYRRLLLTILIFHKEMSSLNRNFGDIMKENLKMTKKTDLEYYFLSMAAVSKDNLLATNATVLEHLLNLMEIV